MKRICSVSIALFCLVLRSDAQIFGGTPPSVKWRVIQTIPARIIYPPGLYPQATQVAFLISCLSRYTLSTIGTKQRPVDIVLHNLTTISNGYVQLAPFRSEFQLNPEQNSFDLGSLPWNQMLAIHEYRHVQQYNNFRVGLSKAFYILFGQDGLALANSLSVPDWFFEGDAVYQETLVSRQGRGRLPLFLTGFEALWVSKKNYSWMKLRNGSYRDYTPDHYPLGYMLVAYGRDTYGKDFWAKTAVQAAAFKGLFYPLQKAIRRNSGTSFDSFHLKALDYFKGQVSAASYTNYAAVFGKSKLHFVADQLFPQFTDSNHLVLINSDYHLPPAFVRIETETQKSSNIKYKAVSIDNSFSYRNEKLVYAAYEPDLRWAWQDYSVLRVLDLNTKKDRRLTRKTKYFSPDISADGNRIVTVNMGTDGISSLHILDSRFATLLLKLPSDSLVYTYPKFYRDSEIVVAARDARGQMAILEINTRSGLKKPLTEWTMEAVGFLSTDSSDIYFTRTTNGEDQGFRLHDGKIYSLLADAGAGNYQLAAGFGKLTWNSFTSAGYRTQVTRLQQAFTGVPQTVYVTDTNEKHNVYSLDDPPFRIPSSVPDSGEKSAQYRSLTHPFNFYSWRPYINDPDFQLALLGQNVLNTFQSEIFVGYNRNEEYKDAGVNFSYGGLFPVVSVGTEYLIDRNAYYRSHKVYWNELLTYAGVSVPLNLSRGRWLTSLSGGSNISYHKNYYQTKDSIANGGYFSLDPNLFFSHQLQAGKMQFYPSFAQVVSVLYNRSFSTPHGNQFLSTGNFFFPGFTNTHSMLVRGSWQQRDSLNQIRFSNSFPFSRGYSGENFYRMYGFGLNYAMPLAYPDWGFANIIYLLRIRANAFFDYTGVPNFATNGPGVQEQYRSTGIEIFLDTKWWNQLPITLGIRYTRLLDADYEGRGPNQWELILPLNVLDKGYSNKLMNL